MEHLRNSALVLITTGLISSAHSVAAAVNFPGREPTLMAINASELPPVSSDPKVIANMDLTTYIDYAVSALELSPGAPIDDSAAPAAGGSDSGSGLVSAKIAKNDFNTGIVGYNHFNPGVSNTPVNPGPGPGPGPRFNGRLDNIHQGSFDHGVIINSPSAF